MEPTARYYLNIKKYYGDNPTESQKRDLDDIYNDLSCTEREKLKEVIN